MTPLDVARETRVPDIEEVTLDVRHFPTLAGADELLTEVLPQMLPLLDKPHVNNRAEWRRLRDEMDELFTDCGWNADESRVAFDLLVAFATSIHSRTQESE